MSRRRQNAGGVLDTGRGRFTLPRTMANKSDKWAGNVPGKFYVDAVTVE